MEHRPCYRLGWQADGWPVLSGQYELPGHPFPQAFGGGRKAEGDGLCLQVVVLEGDVPVRQQTGGSFFLGGGVPEGGILIL